MNSIYKNFNIKEHCKLFGLKYTTVISHIRQGRCRWPRKINKHQTHDIAYKCWQNMMQRVYKPTNPAFSRYGHLDIDPRWQVSFDDFLADMGPRPSKKHSIDRIDNNRGYWPDNCRWATATQQNRNKESYKGNIIYSVSNRYRVRNKDKWYSFSSFEDAFRFREEVILKEC